MLAMLINKLLPPYDKNGKVTPVTGIKPTTTIKFKRAWAINANDKPKDKYFKNKSLCFIDIFIHK